MDNAALPLSGQANGDRLRDDIVKADNGHIARLLVLEDAHLGGLVAFHAAMTL